MKVRSDLLKHFTDVLYENNFLQINTPKIIGESSEGGADVF